MIEVEIKLPIGDAYTKIETMLLNKGFTLSSHIKEDDTYFDNREGYVRKSGQALRIRQETDLSQSHSITSLITFKGRRLDQETVTRPEYETKVEDGVMAFSILQALGYHPVQPVVSKERATYTCGDLTACLDRVKGLGDFLELEILVEENQDAARETALQKIEVFLSELGYSLSDTVKTSYLSMLQRQIITQL